MPPKKSQEGSSDRSGRSTRKNESKEKNSLEEVSTPVDLKPQENLAKDLQDKSPLPICENIVAVPAEKQRSDNESSFSSNSSGLEQKKLIHTTFKKSGNNTTSHTNQAIPQHQYGRFSESTAQSC